MTIEIETTSGFGPSEERLPRPHSAREPRAAQRTWKSAGPFRAAATYNAAADDFDLPALGFWERFGHKTVDRMRLEPGASVLDVGCGTGASALHAARKVGPSGLVLGVDVARSLLAQAEHKARQRRLGNVEFRVADMAKLDFADESFDAVVCVFAIFFVPDMVRQLAELWRLVKPGGQLAITTWGRALFEPGNSIFWSAVRRMRPELEPAYSPWERVTAPRSLRNLFLDAGAEEPELLVEAGVQPLRRAADWWDIVRGTGYRWTLEQLADDEYAELKAENLRRVEQSGARSVLTNALHGIARKRK
jgi:ubiquinone/menaquinone biosynthesis C-methylase UbiE